MISRGFDPENDCPYPGECPNHGRLTSHYHCAHCKDPRPTSYLGHHVGGNRSDARVICDERERYAYLQSIR